MIEEEIARFDWRCLQGFMDSAKAMPDYLRGLAASESEYEAVGYGDRIAVGALSDGVLSEVCVAVASVLVSGIPDMHSTAKSVAFDVLAQVGSADVYGPKVEQVGDIDVNLCRRVVARGFEHYLTGLRAMPSTQDRVNCVDLITIAGHVNPDLRSSAIAALESARKDPALASIVELIDASCVDLMLGSAE